MPALKLMQGVERGKAALLGLRAGGVEFESAEVVNDDGSAAPSVAVGIRTYGVADAVVRYCDAVVEL